MSFQYIIPLPYPERWARAQTWPWTAFRIYRFLRRKYPEIGRRGAWRVAKNWFHRWVWNYQDLPWA